MVRWRVVLDRIYRTARALAVTAAVGGPLTVGVALVHDWHVERTDQACFESEALRISAAKDTNLYSLIGAAIECHVDFGTRHSERMWFGPVSQFRWRDALVTVSFALPLVALVLVNRWIRWVFSPERPPPIPRVSDR